jgi:hypothetical protein
MTAEREPSRYADSDVPAASDEGLNGGHGATPRAAGRARSFSDTAVGHAGAFPACIAVIGCRAD